MHCPKCKTDMVVLELDQVEIDHCVTCGGIWLDKGELELLMLDTDRQDSFLLEMTNDDRIKEKLVKCPICRKKMEKVACGKDKKIRLDRCKKNHGIWFDKGELFEVLKIICPSGDSRVLKLLKDMFAAQL
jgi:uncharacterized protein